MGGSADQAERAVRDHIDYSITQDVAGFHSLVAGKVLT
jgi:hypothetical protein